MWFENQTSIRILGDITPYERFHREMLSLAGLPDRGQRVWVHSSTRTRFDAR